jgi:small GTP-binding protein
LSYDKLFKLVLIGDNGVGKSTIRNRYGFRLDEDDTEGMDKVPMGVERYGKDVELLDAGICRIHIWELRRDKQILSILPNCLEGANGIIFLFDMADKSTLSLLDDWLELLREKDPDIPIMIVGNKVDAEKKRALGRFDSFEFAHDRYCSAYIEISAQTGKKVEIMFHMMTQIMWDYDQYKKNKKKI